MGRRSEMGVKTANQFCSPGCVCKRFVFFGSMLAGVGSASIFPLSMASGYSLAVCQQLPASHK